MATTPDGTAAAPDRTPATGSIYDLGYRHYDGPRLGRRHAVATLVVSGIRSVFGLGRSARSKILPAVCLTVPALVALVVVGIRALLAQRGVTLPPGLPDHATMPGIVAAFAMILVAAQAPELLGRDVRYRVLALYFARALLRLDYALAKLAALTVAVLVAYLVPQAVLLVGNVLVGSDVGGALRDEAGKLPAILGSAIVQAAVTAAFALAIASFATRRAYATAAVFVAFTVPAVIATIVLALDLGQTSHYIVLIDIGALLDGVTAWLFAAPATSDTLARAFLPAAVPALGAVVVGLVSTAILVRRYQGIAA